jgi:hypothetical protein
MTSSVNKIIQVLNRPVKRAAIFWGLHPSSRGLQLDERKFVYYNWCTDWVERYETVGIEHKSQSLRAIFGVAGDLLGITVCLGFLQVLWKDVQCLV